MNTSRKLPFCKQTLSYFAKNDNRVIVFDHSSGKSFIISYKAYNVLHQLNGQDDISLFLKTMENVSEAELLRMISNFAKSDLVYYGSGDDKGTKPCALWNDIKRYRLILVNNTNNSVLYRYPIVPKFLKAILLCSPFSCILLMNTVIKRYSHIDISLTFQTISIIISLFMLSLIIHESSHAIIAKCFNADIGEVGIILEPKIPFIRFYVNICGLSYIRKKRHLFLIHVGGVLGNIFLICIGSIVYIISDTQLQVLGLLIILVNTFCVIIDLMPFYSSDGLEIYKDAIAILHERKAAVENNSDSE